MIPLERTIRINKEKTRRRNDITPTQMILERFDLLSLLLYLV